MILTKDRSGASWGWITISLPSRKARDTTSFEITKNKKGLESLYAQCEKHFDELWELSAKNGPEYGTEKTTEK
jgi:uncharacterized membrane-anchored protein YhcB (DUF1043 family)